MVQVIDRTNPNPGLLVKVNVQGGVDVQVQVNVEVI